MATHCLSQLSFNYVGLGQAQSDALESMFGRLRQSSGANYWISLKQVLDSDQKIKTASLLKHSNATLSEIAALRNEQEVCAARGPDPAEEALVEQLEGVGLPEAGADDLAAIFNCTGALVRSELRLRRACCFCKDLLVDSSDRENSPNAPEAALTSAIDRGGLLRPSTSAFALAVKAWSVYEAIDKTPVLKGIFLGSRVHRACFKGVVAAAIERDFEFADVACLTVPCEGGHGCLESLLGRLFNVMTKNLVRRLAEEAAASTRMKAAKRLAAKLNSKPSDKL